MLPVHHWLGGGHVAVGVLEDLAPVFVNFGGESGLVFFVACGVGRVGVGAGRDDNNSICVAPLHAPIIHDVLGEVVSAQLLSQRLTLLSSRRGP